MKRTPLAHGYDVQLWRTVDDEVRSSVNALERMEQVLACSTLSGMLAWGPLFSEEKDPGSADSRIEQLTRYIRGLQVG